MRIVALVCNLASLAFTLLVLVTDGLSPETRYRVLTVALVLIPVISVVVLLRGPKTATATTITFLLNVGSLGAICWAVVGQYPHPAEPGFWPFVVLTLATPMLTILALLTAKRWSSHHRRLRNA